MSNALVIQLKKPRIWKKLIDVLTTEQWVIFLSILSAVIATMYSFTHGYIVSYGDAESHLNIAKRVVDSLTPGFAQLGGIWLPIPHILLMPFVYFDMLWRTGLAGSIVSGIAYVISVLFTYRLALILTKDKTASFVAALALMLNPNILYLQSTPMTELTLIVFFILSGYYFVRYLLDDSHILYLILAALFGFFATLSRYDGWALVLMEAGVLGLYYFPFKPDLKSIWQMILTIWRGYSAVGDRLRQQWGLMEGRIILYSTLAFFGVALWLLWDWLILGDPLYFTHSAFSAKSQQMSWQARGELPAFHNVPISLMYYTFTAMESMGIILSVAGIYGMYVFAREKVWPNFYLILPVLLVPFFFNVLTLFLGQSVIFLPGVTPDTFEWTLFNVRYGVMMVPVFALFIGYLFYNSQLLGRMVIVGLMGLQCGLFLIGFSDVLALKDGTSGLSSATAKMPDAQFWFAEHYDYGILLTDDFARTISIVRTPVAMKDVIYIGNKPYWEESLIEPQKYARWIIMQKNDTLWKEIYERPEVNARLYQHFNKVYTSEDILIFRRIDGR